MNEIEANVSDDMMDLGTDDIKEKRPPAYSVFATGDVRIPVGKGVGSMWQSRYETAKRHAERYFDISENVHKYYQNTLDNYRMDTGGEDSGMAHTRRDLRHHVTYVENVVFANAQAVMPHLYSQNPSVSILSNKEGPEETDALAITSQKLINVLANKKGDRGLGLKLKVRRAILASKLFNEAYIEVGYQKRKEAIEDARRELDKLSASLEKAKTEQAVEETEAKIALIEKNFDFLLPAGPWCRYRSYCDVLVDPASVEEDMSDARYVMIAEFLPTMELKAQYGKKQRDGTYKSIYKPTHVLAAGNNGPDQTAYDSIVDDADYKKHGFQDSESYEKALHTRVWKVWDKTTRRVYMFNEADWSWPIFVWDDPYELDNFFPIDRLWSVIDPMGGRAKPEFAYILDQQDMIDQKNSYRARAVEWATNKVVYNKNAVNKQDIDRLLSTTSHDRAIGLDIGEDRKLSDVLGTVLPPGMAVAELFDTQNEFQAIERITAISDVMRGGQFKTNTTNKAVESYADIVSARVSDHRASIEDFVGRVLWKVLQMCLQYMSQEEVMGLVGRQLALGWYNMSSQDIQSSLSLEVAGGSTTKPTSHAKKQEAIELMQALGQFAQVPSVLLVVMIVMRRAFSDSFLIENAEWDQMIQQIQQAVGMQEQGDSQGAEQVMQAIVQRIDSLSPEQKVAMGEALAQGTSLKEVLATLSQGENANEQRRPERPA